MKQCSKCGKVKSLDSFYKRTGVKDGYRSWCKECLSQQHKEYYSKPENHGRHLKIKREYNNASEHKIYAKNHKLQSRYGISLEEYNQKITAQDSKCAICGIELDGGKNTHLDHDHKTGKNRGVLCVGCNSGLGNFKDSLQALEFACEYLKGWQE